MAALHSVVEKFTRSGLDPLPRFPNCKAETIMGPLRSQICKKQHGPI